MACVMQPSSCVEVSGSGRARLDERINSFALSVYTLIRTTGSAVLVWCSMVRLMSVLFISEDVATPLHPSHPLPTCTALREVRVSEVRRQRLLYFTLRLTGLFEPLFVSLQENHGSAG